MQGTARRSPRVLVVEDQMTVAVYIATLLEDIGCAPVGPVGHVTTALPLALTEPLDAALLDIDLAGDSVEPIADVLERRNIPYAVVTAYRRDRVPCCRVGPISASRSWTARSRPWSPTSSATTDPAHAAASA